MSKEKLYGLRDQLSKFLYDPTPDQAAWRKKMWDEGRFDESMDITKRVETQLEGVEKQIEAFEAAEPELGEKMVTNFLLNLPLGKQLKGTGLGSLLGIAEEEMGAAEAQRLKDIEQKLNQLNSIYQQEGRGMEEMEALKQEKEGLMSLLGDTPTTGEDPIIEDIKKGLYDAGRFWQAGIDEDSSLYEALDQYKNLDSKGQAQVKDMLREDMFERLGLEDARADERFFSDSGAFDAELVDQHLNKELAGEYPKIFEKMGPLTKEVKPYMTASPVSRKFDKAFAQRNPTIIREVRDTSEFFGIKLDEAELQKLSAKDAAIVKEVIKKEKRASKMIPEIQEYLGSTEKREVYRDIDAYYKPYLDILNKKIKSYQAGGLIMNYGDYGRSYK